MSDELSFTQRLMKYNYFFVYSLISLALTSVFRTMYSWETLQHDKFTYIFISKTRLDKHSISPRTPSSIRGLSAVNKVLALKQWIRFTLKGLFFRVNLISLLPVHPEQHSLVSCDLVPASRASRSEKERKVWHWALGTSPVSTVSLVPLLTTLLYMSSDRMSSVRLPFVGGLSGVNHFNNLLFRAYRECKT